MPYIPKDHRPLIDHHLEGLKEGIRNAGELNYTITTICNLFIISRRFENYDTYNEIIGVLECAKLEFYRRKISKYEDKKIHENGDVY